MIIRCNWNSERYSRKPTDQGKVQEELSHPVDIELRELAESLAQGCNVRPSECYGTKDRDWKSQQLFLIDIDNKSDPKLSPEQAYQMAVESGLKVSFMYYTHSSTDQCPKYRIAFVMDEKITNLDLRNRVMNALLQAYRGYADESCKNPSRLFYGGHSGKVLYPNYEAVNRADDVLMMMPKEETPTEQHRAERSEHIISEVDTDNIRAIEKHDWKYLRGKVGSSVPVEFDNNEQFFRYLYHDVDMSELLGVDEKALFKCILHDDHVPSANIFRPHGVWTYACYGCNVRLNIKQLVEKIGKFQSEYQSLEFLKSVYNLKIAETDWTIEQRENIDRILECLSRTDDWGFATLCPTANNNIRSAKMVFMEVLCMAKSAIYPKRQNGIDGNVIFSLSVRQIADRTGKNSLDKVNKYLKILIYHDMLRIIPIEQIPKAWLAKAIGAKGGDGHKLTQFYSVPSWVQDHLEVVESNGRRWKENGYRLNGISFETFYRVEGKEVANRLYPQSKTVMTAQGIKQRTTSKTADRRHEQILDIVIELVQEQGYATEKQILSHMDGNRNRNDIQLKRSITDIMHGNGLKKIRANKAIKEQYRIQSKGYPSIIVME